jgi:predicted phosphoserine aminotransferase
MSQTSTTITIPTNLLPADGRFGCGPSKVRPEAVEALGAVGTSYLGTSHRQDTVKSMVGRLRSGLGQFFSLPDGYEVVLGNGGSTGFWDVATFGLIENRSQHTVFGEFSSKFAEASAAAPHLGTPTIIEAPVGSSSQPQAEDGIDTYCLVHNETSTGVAVEPRRPAGTSSASNQLIAVDATSGAGGLAVDITQTDCYYFAPQKCFASDGGLWIAILSPAAVERVNQIHNSQRWIPASMDLWTALDNSRKNQTYNTPALATILLMVHQLEWMNNQGGLDWASKRCAESANHMYTWAQASTYAAPFVVKPIDRSNVVATIDLDEVDANEVCKVLRANGIVDTDSYRKLGRNQLRMAMFPAIDPDDVARLTGCVDYVVNALRR